MLEVTTCGNAKTALHQFIISARPYTSIIFETKINVFQNNIEKSTVQWAVSITDNFWQSKIKKLTPPLI